MALACAAGMKRTGYLLYGVASYAIFLVTFLYAIAFVGNFWPALGWSGPLFRSMDFGGPPAPLGEALFIDALLLGLFAVQHSVMARVGFKKWSSRVIPKPIERSTFVLATCICLVVLYWQWRPIPTTVLWSVSGTPATLILVVSLVGWLMALLSTVLLDHFELFGLKQVWCAFRGVPHAGLEFRTPLFYKAVRHPLYLGFMIAFWATPLMTLGHLVFAAATTGYMLVAIQLEERDLIRLYGDAYVEYRRKVWMLLPFPRQSDSIATMGSTRMARRADK
jgi:protein-S-isoprenylcysteine O-methyltransferase Ste14